MHGCEYKKIKIHKWLKRNKNNKKKKFEHKKSIIFILAVGEQERTFSMDYDRGGDSPTWV